jgi:hypothetical protein
MHGVAVSLFGPLWYGYGAQLLAYTTAIHHYGRGLAFAVLGRVAEAEDEQRLLAVAAALVPPDRVVHNNTCTDLLRVADAMLQGEVLYRQGE